jgi:hypothetical protein
MQAMNRLSIGLFFTALALAATSTTVFAQVSPVTTATDDAGALVGQAPAEAPVSAAEPTAAPEPVPAPEPAALPEPTGPVEAATPAPAPEPGSAVSARYVLGEGLTLRSESGDYTLKIKGYMQLRATVLDNVQDENAASTELLVRRMRVSLSGQLVVPELTYAVQLGFANRDSESDLRVPLLEAWLSYAPLRDLAFRVGQGKVPFGSQATVSSATQQFVDTSIMQSELQLDYDTGIYAYSKDLLGLGNRIQYQLGVFAGDGRNRLSTRSGLLWVARLEFTPFGKFDTNAESDVTRGDAPRLQFAFGAALNKNSVRDRSTTGGTYTLGGFDYQHLEADLMFKLAGFSFQAEWMWRNATDLSHSAVQPDGTTLTERARPAWGYFVSAGYLLPCGFEVAARYGDVHPRAGSTAARSRELGGGLSYYFEKHALKVQADYFFLFGDGTPDNAFDGGNHQVRVQAQLQF